MKKRIRLFAMILCMCQLLSLMGCGGQPAETTVPPENSAPAESLAETIETPTTLPTFPEEVSKVIPWGAEGPIAEQAKNSGEMIICFMSGEGTKISGSTSQTAFSDTKWGDSSLIAFPNGEIMLIDGGMADYGPLLVENLHALGVERIDYLVLSHRHDDHYGGLLRNDGVMDSFPVGVVYTSGAYNGRASDPLRLEGKCSELNIPHEVLRQGDVLSIGEVTMEVLWPNPEVIGTYHPTTEATNNGSLVLRFEYGEISALFAGDLYVGAEAELMNAVDPAKLDADILKMPHHGRSTSNSKGFAKAVSPQIAAATGAIIMETSIYTNYARLGTRVFMDVYDGYLMVRTDGVNLRWKSSRVRDVPAYDKLDNAFDIDRNSPE